MAFAATENELEEVVIVAIEEVIVVSTETKADETNCTKKEKPPKEKKRKAPKGSKLSPAHLPYFQMIKEVIYALKEKGGSSPRAISKYMEEKHKVVLPPNYKNLFVMHIKNLILVDKLTKVKDYFKLVEGVKKVPTKNPFSKYIKKKTSSKPKTAPKSAKPTSKPNETKKVAKAPATSKTIVVKPTKDAKPVALEKKPVVKKVVPTSEVQESQVHQVCEVPHKGKAHSEGSSNKEDEEGLVL